VNFSASKVAIPTPFYYSKITKIKVFFMATLYCKDFIDIAIGSSTDASTQTLVIEWDLNPRLLGDCSIKCAIDPMGSP